MLASQSRRTNRSVPVVLTPSVTFRAVTPDSKASYCDCPAHRAADASRLGRSEKASLLSMLAPLFVCAFCPACLTLWAPLFASLGVGFALPEAVHPAAMGVAAVVALAPAMRRAHQARFWKPVWFVCCGAVLFLVSHAIEGGRVIELGGALCLVLGNVLERRLSGAQRRAVGAAA